MWPYRVLETNDATASECHLVCYPKLYKSSSVHFGERKKKTSSLQPTWGTNSACFRIWPNEWELHMKYSVWNTSEDKMNSQLCWLITRRALTFIPSPWNGAERQKNLLGAPTDLPAHSLLTGVPEQGWGSKERRHEGKQQKLHFTACCGSQFHIRVLLIKGRNSAYSPSQALPLLSSHHSWSVINSLKKKKILRTN